MTPTLEQYEHLRKWRAAFEKQLGLTDDLMIQYAQFRVDEYIRRINDMEIKAYAFNQTPEA